MKIVINDCYGGFGLSRKAEVEYLKLKGKEAFFYTQPNHGDTYVKVEPDCDCLMSYTFTKDLGETFKEWPKGGGGYFIDIDIERTDKDLVAVVEMLGEEANGSCAELKVIEIPDDIDWELSEYDGIETIEEKHRSWG